MSIPSVALNEDSPAGSAYIRGGDDRIREYKLQVREILTVDHYFPSSGQNDACGRHKWMTLIETDNIGTGVVGGVGVPAITVLGGQTVSGKSELVYTDEDNNDVQITSGGKIRAASMGGVYAAANLAAIATIMALIYPVGSIYISTVSTNPGTLLGIGTWVAFGVGKTLVGLNGAETEFDVVEETGGEKTHTLLTTEIPAHTHAIGAADGAASTAYAIPASLGTAYSDIVSKSTGGGGAHNNLQPYIVVYMWKRTA